MQLLSPHRIDYLCFDESPIHPTAHLNRSLPSSPALENPGLPKDDSSIFPDPVGFLWLLSSTSSEDSQRFLPTQFTGLRQRGMRSDGRREADIHVGGEGVGWSTWALEPQHLQSTPSSWAHSFTCLCLRVLRCKVGITYRAVVRLKWVRTRAALRTGSGTTTAW